MHSFQFFSYQKVKKNSTTHLNIFYSTLAWHSYTSGVTAIVGTSVGLCASIIAGIVSDPIQARTTKSSLTDTL